MGGGPSNLPTHHGHRRQRQEAVGDQGEERGHEGGQAVAASVPALFFEGETCSSPIMYGYLYLTKTVTVRYTAEGEMTLSGTYGLNK